MSRLLFFCAFLLASMGVPAHAAPQPEALGRGLVAVKVNGGVYLSWRLLASDGYYTTNFNIYRNDVCIATIGADKATCYTDATGTAYHRYAVRAVHNGIEETSRAAAILPWASSALTIQLRRPANDTTPPNHFFDGKSGGETKDYPNGEPYSYTPNDCSIADLDGDGEMEIIVKWDPSNSRDNSFTGFSGKVFIDAYKLNGTFLWRIDLGINIRAGAHYTQFMVYDFDGDGKAEMVCKTAPGTKDGVGNNVIIGSDDPNADYRDHTLANGKTGFITKGPEYLTLFDGMTGAALHSVSYEPGRDPANGWGKNETTNRVDRFLACVAYLDGEHPCAVMGRGYYGRLTMCAWRVVNKRLVKQWLFDSNAAGNSAAAGQGNHNLSVADVDGDGKDEIIYGACAVNNDGTLMYATGCGHGDAMHLSDLDPDRPGLEVWEVHEEKTSGKWDYEMHDARTGEIIWKSTTYATDNGRGLAADIDASHRGFEMWSSADGHLFDCKGNAISDKKPSPTNFRIYWDSDLQDELLDGNAISKWNGSKANSLVTLNGSSCNSTKKTPCISADILGDWREEVLLYNTSNPSQLLLYTTTIATTNRVVTPLHDHVYRMGIAWQNVAYNQPPHLGYYLPDSIGTGAKRRVRLQLDLADSVSNMLTILVETGKPFADLMPTPVRDGFVFDGWYFTDDIPYHADTTLSAASTLFAKWSTAVWYTVTFSGEGIATWDTTVLDGTRIAMPATPQREGYSFVEWLHNDTAWSFDAPVTQDVALVAAWSRNITWYTVTFSGEGIAPHDTSVVAGSQILAPPTPVRDGYEFTAWMLGEAAWNFTSSVDSDLTLVASWREIPEPLSVHSASAKALRIYPNPSSSGVVCVEVPDGADRIQVFTPLGALVYEQRAEHGTVQLHLSHLPQGAYLLRCGGYTGKLILHGGS